MNETSTGRASKTARISGWIITILLVPLLCFSAYAKLAKVPDAVEGMGKYGYPEHLLVPLGIVELACAIIYLVPQTSVLGAVLLTGYLGGATATHVRVGDHFFMPIIIGVLVWLGLFLRDPRLRVLIPLRR